MVAFSNVMGLNMKFDEVKGRIIGRQKFPSTGEESRRLVMLGKKGTISTEIYALEAEFYAENVKKFE